MVEETVQLSVIWDAMTVMGFRCNETSALSQPHWLMFLLWRKIDNYNLWLADYILLSVVLVLFYLYYILCVEEYANIAIDYVKHQSRGHLNIKTIFPRCEITMLKIRWSQDSLNFNMGIPILVRQHLYSDMVLRFFVITKHPIQKRKKKSSVSLTHKQLETHGYMYTLLCGYWCPGAKIPGHQYPQCD